MKSSRPKNLNLFTIRFPLPAIVSILHRLSGVALFALIPLALWTLEYSLTYQGFDTLQMWFGETSIKLLCWALLMPFCYHLVAGIRHLLSDMQIGNSFTGGKRTAMMALLMSLVLIILTGIWIW